VEAGALVDETYNLSRSVFRFGAPGGRLLTMNNTQDLVVYYADFPTNFTGSLYNVSKTNDAGSITFVDASGDFSGESFEQDPYGRVNWGLVPKSLSINVLLEGLYNPVTHKMNKARNGNVEQYPGDVADKITVELRSASNYSTLIYSIPNIDLSTNGQATTTVPGTYSGMYYITIRHRNHVTTTTSTPVSFSGTPVNYSFNNPSQAFGGNLKLLPTGAYGIYAGNVNIDNKVDNSDLYCIRTDAAAFASGYLTNDVNGDGIVDVLDLIMTDNNVAAFIMVKTPE
jgi:hypothetical protein